MKNKFLVAILGGTLTLALVAGAAAFLATRSAQAQEDLASRELRSVFGPAGLDASDTDGITHGRPGKFPGDEMPGFSKPGMKDDDQTYLAEALGISVEELQAARQAAWEKGLQQLVDAGEITQVQAERLAERGFSLKMGQWLAPDASLDYDALLAAELGISVNDLNAAREKAQELGLQAAIDSGKITQEQADLIKARQAVMPYLNREDLTAKALGMSVAELQAAIQDGSTLPDVITAQGLDGIEFQKAMLDAYQAAIQQAVQDGVITQAQAEVFLNQGVIGGLRMPGRPGMDARHHGGPSNFHSQPEMIEPENEL